MIDIQVQISKINNEFYLYPSYISNFFWKEIKKSIVTENYVIHEVLGESKLIMLNGGSYNLTLNNKFPIIKLDDISKINVVFQLFKEVANHFGKSFILTGSNKNSIKMSIDNSTNIDVAHYNLPVLIINLTNNHPNSRIKLCNIHNKYEYIPTDTTINKPDQALIYKSCQMFANEVSFESKGNKKEICSICKKEKLAVSFPQCIDTSDDYFNDNHIVSSIICTTCIKNNNYGFHNRYDNPHYYDKNKHGKCPCIFLPNFKKDIKLWNTDVLDYYAKDAYSHELYGIELEVGSHVRNREFYRDILNETVNLVNNDAILKYDSSIDYLDGSEKKQPNCYKGFEIVTRPMTYKNSVNFIKELTDNRHNLLRSWEVGTTGIHIHVNKEYLSKLDIGKLLLFINSERNRHFITFIAKRENKKYAKFIKRNILDYKDKSHNCHYYALNTSKPNTIEFRMFRGTLNKNTLLSYLQFVKSLIEFIKCSPIGGKAPYISTHNTKLNVDNYVNWLLFNTERSQYRELKNRVAKYNCRETDISSEGEV